MAKYVSLSFDDGRWDMYVNAFPIMKNNGLTGTINIITDFVENPANYAFRSCKNRSVTREQVLEMYNNGFEVASHGHTHNNSLSNIRKCLDELRTYGVKGDIGFASPQSYYCTGNNSDVMMMQKEGEISYVRSGIQTKREGIVYSILTLIERKTHSKFLFYYLNKRCYMEKGKGVFYLSASVTRYTTVNQILYLIRRMKDGSAIILNFHSILYKEDPGYGYGDWFWDAERFKQLCICLSSDKHIHIINTAKMIEE